MRAPSIIKKGLRDALAVDFSECSRNIVSAEQTECATGIIQSARVNFSSQPGATAGAGDFLPNPAKTAVTFLENTLTRRSLAIEALGHYHCCGRDPPLRRRHEFPPIGDPWPSST
jgi:hypothetical protein